MDIFKHSLHPNLSFMETFTPEQIRDHLERVLAAPSFADSIVLTRFLTFIVNETLEGRSHELKEYTIAIDALKKGADFNPQIDSIVRIHAGRLRRALKEFYYEEGAPEEIQIVVKKGSYVPTFVKNAGYGQADGSVSDRGSHLTVSRGAAQLHKNSLAILPFEDISEIKAHCSFVKGLDIYLSTSLTSNSHLSVISHLSSSHLPEHLKGVREAGAILNASFILTGCVQFDKHLRVHVLLNLCETGAQLWGMTIEKKNLEKIDLFALQEEIVSRITTSVSEVVEGYSENVSDKAVFDKQGDPAQVERRGLQYAN
jgi:TolB-like protein